jgi:hypothetical protein
MYLPSRKSTTTLSTVPKRPKPGKFYSSFKRRRGQAFLDASDKSSLRDPLTSVHSHLYLRPPRSALRCAWPVGGPVSLSWNGARWIWCADRVTALYLKCFDILVFRRLLAHFLTHHIDLFTVSMAEMHEKTLNKWPTPKQDRTCVINLISMFSFMCNTMVLVRRLAPCYHQHRIYIWIVWSVVFPSYSIPGLKYFCLRSLSPL